MLCGQKKNVINKMDILCVGDILADIIISPLERFEYDNTCTKIEQTLLKPGGDAFNNSIDMARLGNRVACIGRIGNDIFGEYLFEEGMRQGVDMSYCVRSTTAPHAKSIILINRDGNRKFFYYAGSNDEFSMDDINVNLLDSCKILQVGGTFHFPNFDGRAGCADLLRMAKEKGVITSMDVNTDFTGKWNETISPCYPYLDYFLPSLEQAVCITKENHNIEKMADFFLERGVKNVVIKMGDQGSYCKRGCGEAFYCGCYSVPVVETTGAGDAFVAGFLTAVLKGKTIRDCVAFGTACSALVVQAIGATTGMKDYNAIEQFMREHEPLIYVEG